MNIFVNTPFYEYLCKNKNLAKLFEPPHKKKKIAEENLHMIVESELRIEMGQGGSIFYNAKIQCVVVEKCQKEPKLTIFLFLKVEFLSENPPTLDSPKNKLHFRKCLNTVLN